MNGRVAKMTRLPRRSFASLSRQVLSRQNLRTLLLLVACGMSLALLGAVRLAPQFASRDEMPPPGAAPAASASAGEADLLSGDVVLAAVSPRGAEPFLTKMGQPDLVPAVARPGPADGPDLLHESLAPAATPKVSGAHTRTILMEVTAYCPCPRCCGPRAQGLTASGRPVHYNGGRFVAADTRILKFNTKLRIPGYAENQPVEVIDRGGAIKGHKLDVFFPTHQEARQWGRQKLFVTVVEE